MNQNTNKKAGISPVIMAIVFVALLSIFSLSAIPAYAHAPEGAGEAPEVVIEPIQIYSRDGTLLEISIDDVAEVHGELCLCVAGGFRATQAAISALYDEEELPAQGDLTLVYHHPGKGHKQAFDLILTPECVTYEKLGNPQHMNLDHWVYTFTRVDTGEVFETQVKEGVIAQDFFDHRYAVNGIKKGWHEDEPSEEEKAAFASGYTETLNNVLTLPLWEIYSGIEEPEEPAPVGGIIFSSALVLAIGVGFIYSSRLKRR
jgi:hypothetical protein